MSDWLSLLPTTFLYLWCSLCAPPTLRLRTLNLFGASGALHAPLSTLSVDRICVGLLGALWAPFHSLPVHRICVGHLVFLAFRMPKKTVGKIHFGTEQLDIFVRSKYYQRQVEDNGPTKFRA